MKNKLAGLSQQEVYAYIEAYVYKHYQQDICAARGGGVCYSGTLPGDRGYGLPDDRLGYGLPREAIVNEFRQAESSFAVFLFELIDAAKLKDADVYKRADVSKSVFSKIRQGQHPDKKTAIALAETEGQGGVMTPGAALGEELVRRLEAHAGLSFTVEA